MSSWMRHYPSMGIQIGRRTNTVWYNGFLMRGSQFIVIIIWIIHLLAFWAYVIAIITPRLVTLSDIAIRVSPMATGSWVSITAATVAAALGPATGVGIIVATAATGNLELLHQLLTDLVAFAIVRIVYCVGSHWVYLLCMYTISNACHHSLHSTFLSPITYKYPWQSCK